jgi:hypothetical protein
MAREVERKILLLTSERISRDKNVKPSGIFKVYISKSNVAGSRTA